MTTLIDTVTARSVEAKKTDGLAIRAREALNHTFDMSGDMQTKICVLPFNSPTQEPDGQVRLCSASSTFGYADETNLGFIQEEGFANVWRNEKYRHIRKSLLTGDKLEPYCGACEYRHSGPAWMLQLHVSLMAYQSGVVDDDNVRLIRRWAHRYEEYRTLCDKQQLNWYRFPWDMFPEGPPPSPLKDNLNTELPEVLIDASKMPLEVDFNTLNRCNVSCIMCPPAVEYDDLGVKRKPYFRLGIEEFNDTCDQLNIKLAHFVGAYAEPLMNKDIFKLIRAAHDRGAITAITTNATALVPQFAEKLLDAGLDAMTISLHGATKAIAEKIMRKANFDRVIANIRNLQALKRERGQVTPRISINFVSQLANGHEIPAFVDLASDLDIDYLNIVHLIDGGLADKSWNLIYHPHILGPALIEAKRRAEGRRLTLYISPAYSEFLQKYHATLDGAAA
jgi:radical SAM protein with 4Fe4S-binding SPASM domain